MKKLLILSLITIITACSRDFLSNEPSSNPIEVFETIWKELDEHYAVFEERNVDWNAVYNIYRPKVSSTTTQKDLLQIVHEMLSELDDNHTCLFI